MNFKEIAAPYIKRWPNLWTDLEGKRVELGSKKVTWDKACYLPLGAAFQALKIHQASDIAELKYGSNALALAAWRIGGKHIIKIDPDVQKELLKSGIKGDIPMSIFNRLPFLCAYIEVANNKDLDGIFVYIEDDIMYKEKELRIVFATKEWGLISTLLDFSAKGTLEQIIKQTMKAVRGLDERMAGAIVERIHTDIQSVLPLIMYVCSVNAEIAGHETPAVPTLGNRRLMAVDRVKEWEYGNRIGAAIRASSIRRKTESTGEGAGKRPHVRRAHWHTYRTGPKRSEVILNWLLPMAINALDGADMPETTRPVS